MTRSSLAVQAGIVCRGLGGCSHELCFPHHGHGQTGLAVQAARLPVSVERNLRRPQRLLGLRPAGRRAEAEHQRGLVARHGHRPRRAGRPCRAPRKRTKWSASIARSSCTRRSGSARATTICSTTSWSIAANGRLAFAPITWRPASARGSRAGTPGEDEKCQLTEPREFNLMFKTIVGALGTEEDAAFLRPETAQGIFVNFKNVFDWTRVGFPSASPRWARASATRSRRGISRSARASSSRWRSSSSAIPATSAQWYQYWRDRRWRWYTESGPGRRPAAAARARTGRAEPLLVRHGRHRIRVPFLAAGEFGELEGIAHRGDFDLRSHMEGKLVRAGGCPGRRARTPTASRATAAAART